MIAARFPAFFQLRVAIATIAIVPVSIVTVSIITIAGLALYLSPGHAYADSLTDVLESPEMQKFEQARPTGPNAGKDERWFERDSNFAGLFADLDRGPKSLDEWLGDLSTLAAQGFSFTQKSSGHSPEFLWSERAVSAPGQQAPIIITVLVPHPRYLSMIEMKLMPRFNELEPPSLKISSVETLRFRNSEGNLYHHRNGGCSILFRLPRGGVLNIGTKICSDNSALAKIAGELNIDRLKQKLSS